MIQRAIKSVLAVVAVMGAASCGTSGTENLSEDAFANSAPVQAGQQPRVALNKEKADPVSIAAIERAMGDSYLNDFAEYPAAVRPAIIRSTRLMAACRGGAPAGLPEKDRERWLDLACEQSTHALNAVEKMGMCWGNDDTPTSERKWVSCAVSAHSNDIGEIAPCG